MYVQTPRIKKEEIQTRNKLLQLIKSSSKTATWIIGILLVCFLTAPTNGMWAMQQNQESVLARSDDSTWSAGEPLNNEIQESDWFQWPEITGIDFAKIGFFMAVFLTAYSLVTTGKRGRGWIVVGIIAGAITIIGKGILSMFVEVTREYCPPDWDED